ncbi:MAG: hypothetical protein IPO30_10690 [Hyphomonadaceae bacterium]|jgi:hypothetical protein|nr:hypothetical protein [Hyphomonadaceae bacterium]
MARRVAAVTIFASTLAACGPQTPAVAPESAAPKPVAEQQGNTPSEDLDPFVVMIGAERWTVILDKALEGAREAPDASTSAGETDLYRADAALKRGAAMVIELRNQVCRKGLVTGAGCNLPEWPAWTLEPPTGDTPIAEIDHRSGWLDTVMAPFTDVGCEAGRKALNDEMFCSVE